MIVLDEEIHGASLRRAIAAWYPGRVVSVVALRPGTIVKDEAVPAVLRTVPQPTFVTINAFDFWRKIPADSRFCIVCVELNASQIVELPERLRRFLRMPEFKTKGARLGKVVRLRSRRIEYYAADRVVYVVPWSEPR
jgi:hypothetical protein